MKKEWDTDINDYILKVKQNTDICQLTKEKQYDYISTFFIRFIDHLNLSSKKRQNK